jgi:hypothetical protein
VLLFLVIVGFVGAPAGEAMAQSRCKGTKKWYKGSCRYPDEIERLKAKKRREREAQERKAGERKERKQKRTKRQTNKKSKPSSDDRVSRALRKLDYKFEVTKKSNFRVGFRLESGRTQIVMINSRTSKFGSLEVREIWAPAYDGPAPFPARVSRQLLQANATKKIGGWQVSETLAVFSAKVDADASAAELNSVLRAVATIADKMEKTLTSKDKF